MSAAPVDAALARRLLGRHVLRRAERQARLREPIAAGFVHGERDAEVGDASAGRSWSRMFSGLMSRWMTPRRVRVRERVATSRRDAHRVGHGKLPLAIEPCAKRLAFDERHDVEQQTVPRSPESNSGRMPGCCRLRRRPNLGQEPLGADHRGEFSAEHLEGDLSFVADVLREIHGRHPARAHLALDDVPTDKLGAERGRDG